jgi:copper(I)-binding protein
LKKSSPLFALALLSCSQSPGEAADIQVAHAWARPALAGKTTTAAYLSITNRGGAGDALVAVTSSVGNAQVHSTSMDGGIMRMREVERLPLSAGATVKLEPGGTHVMLTGLNQSLHAGSRLELTLRFEGSQKQRITAEVRAPPGERM